MNTLPFIPGSRVRLARTSTPRGFTRHASRRGAVIVAFSKGCLVMHDAPWWRFWNRRQEGPYGWAWSELEGDHAKESGS